MRRNGAQFRECVREGEGGGGDFSNGIVPSKYEWTPEPSKEQMKVNVSMVCLH